MRFLLVPGFCLSVTIASYSQCNIQLSVVQVNVTCFGASSGSIDLNLTGAVAPYSCYWSNGETTEDLKNLSAGIYSVLVIDASLCTAEGSFTITQPFQPLSIISHPLPQTDCYGNQVVFSAGITGAEGTVVYQWQQKPPGDIFSDITGANNALLIIDNIGMNNKNINGTEYRIMITDDCGSIISYPALLSINTITGLTPADVNSILCNGGNKTYAVSALGTIESYQWFIKNGTNWDALSDAGAW